MREKGLTPRKESLVNNQSERKSEIKRTTTVALLDSLEIRGILRNR